MKLYIYTDGGARGNPGPAAIGIVILAENRAVLKRMRKYIGETTNNQAEYAAVLAALKEAEKIGAEEVHCTLDSQLVQRQLTGEYAVRNIMLKEFFDVVKEQEKKFSAVTYSHVKRGDEFIRQADALVNMALDESASL